MTRPIINLYDILGHFCGFGVHHLVLISCPKSRHFCVDSGYIWLYNSAYITIKSPKNVGVITNSNNIHFCGFGVITILVLILDPHFFGGSLNPLGHPYVGSTSSTEVMQEALAPQTVPVSTSASVLDSFAPPVFWAQRPVVDMEGSCPLVN